MRFSRTVLPLVLAASLASAACGGAATPAGSPGTGDPSVPGVAAPTEGSTRADVVFFRDGAITDEALARVVVDGAVDTALVADLQAAFLQLTPPERNAALQDVSARYELESARISGLVDAIGDEGAAVRAVAGAWVPVGAAVTALDPSSLRLQDASRPSGSRVGEPVARRAGASGRLAAYVPAVRPSRAATLEAADPGSSAGDIGVVGLMLAETGLMVLVDPVVSSANDITSADTYQEGRAGTGTLVTGAVEQSSLEMDFDGQQDGVDVKFHTELVAHPCPDPTGTFDMSAKVDIATGKGTAGARTTLEIAIRGQVDDDAKLAGTEITTRIQTAAFGGGEKGQFVDFTIAAKSHRETAYTVNRTGGALTAELTRMGAFMAAMFHVLLADKLVTVAEKAWSSGRCVRLEPTATPGPKGVKPGSTSTILAPPRSRVDGSAIGGSVTAALTAGGATIDPSAAKVAADATFTYVAPDEAGKSGTVTLEARSKRGVGKATLDFTTAVAPTVTITGPVQYSFNGMTGTATIDLTMSPSPDGSYTGTAQVRMTGTMKLMQTSCTRATWTEAIDLSGELTSEGDDQVLVISTTGEAPSGTSRPMECTTAGVTVQSRTPLLSSSLFGEARIRLVDGDQAFVVTVAPGKVSGTVRVKLS
jgi:hypothetical protein